MTDPSAAAKFHQLLALGKDQFAKGETAAAAGTFLAAWRMDKANMPVFGLVCRLIGATEARALGLEIMQEALDHNGPSVELCVILADLLLTLDMPQIAERALEQAFTTGAKTPDAIDKMAEALERQGKLDQAKALVGPALFDHANEAALHNRMGRLVWLSGDVAGSIKHFKAALTTNPRYFAAHDNLADMLFRLDRFAEALDHADASLAINPQNPEIRYQRALILFSLGRRDEGFADYRHRHNRARRGAVIFQPDLPAWTIGDQSSALFIAAEQGLGDEILFLCALAAVEVQWPETVILSADPRLHSAISRRFPDVKLIDYITKRQAGRTTRFFPGLTDLAVAKPIRSLAMGEAMAWAWPENKAITKIEPVLVPDPDRVAHWRERLAAIGPGPKIGIAWRSGSAKADRRGYYPDPIEWQPVMDRDDIVPIALQYGDIEEDLARFQALYGRRPHHFDGLDLKDDLDEVLALMSALDLIISPATAVAMMAMAGGCPVWWLMRNQGWWRFGQNDIPCAQRQRFYYSALGSDWSPTFEQLAADISHVKES